MINFIWSLADMLSSFGPCGNLHETMQLLEFSIALRTIIITENDRVHNQHYNDNIISFI